MNSVIDYFSSTLQVCLLSFFVCFLHLFDIIFVAIPSIILQVSFPWETIIVTFKLELGVTGHDPPQK